jgi:hypothetical protein
MGSKTTRRPGRPTKLTPETTERILTAVRAGNYLETACNYAGVTYSTVWRWLKDADEPRAPKAKREFRDALARARAEAEIRVGGAVIKSALGGTLVRRTVRTLRDGTQELQEDYAPPDGRVGLEFLSRAFPEHWARRQAVEVTGAAGGPIQVEQATSIAVLAERLAELDASAQELEPSEIIDAEVVEPIDSAASDAG